MLPQVREGGGRIKIPIWLYDRQERHGLRTRRWGSAKPLGVVITLLDEPERPDFAPSWLCAVGRLHLSYGPSGGVEGGHSSLPRGSRDRIFYGRNGLAVGIALCPREAVGA